MNSDKNFNFSSFLRTLNSEPLLIINLDLSAILDQREFVQLARRAKAFLETKHSDQRREATIHCTKNQMTWERNVFGSGVTWEEVVNDRIKEDR